MALSDGWITSIVLGTVVLILLLILVIVFWRRSYKSRMESFINSGAESSSNSMDANQRWEKLMREMESEG